MSLEQIFLSEIIPHKVIDKTNQVIILGGIYMTQKVIIIGGVAGGATSAAKLRRISEDVEIILIERGEYISFANCGLPYYIGETIKDRSKLFVQTVEGMSDRFNVDIRNLSEAVEY